MEFRRRKSYYSEAEIPALLRLRLQAMRIVLSAVKRPPGPLT